MQTHQRLEYMRKLRVSCNVPPKVADASRRWEGRVRAAVIDAARPVVGLLEMFTTHLVVVGEGGVVQYALPFSFMLTIQRKREVHFQSRTFAEPPKIRTLIEIGTTSGMVNVVLEGTVGMQFAKAIELLWRHTFNMLTDREAAMFRCFELGDLLYALSLLPFDIECQFAQKIMGSDVSVVDRPVVLRIDEDMTLSIILRPSTFSEMLERLMAIRMDLDHAVLIHGGGDEIRLIDKRDRIYMFNAVVDSTRAIADLHAIFLANAATAVYRHQLSTKIVQSPLNHEESSTLYDHYSVVDENLDGSISKQEFLVSLGPIIEGDKLLADALYTLFVSTDTTKDRSSAAPVGDEPFHHESTRDITSRVIHVFEYLHGARVLLRGDEEDRTTFLFGLFDPKNLRSINVVQFTAGLKTLQRAAKLFTLPPGETIETFAERAFNEMDEDHSGDVTYDEFTEGLRKESLSSLNVFDALKRHAVIKRISVGRVMSFGHSHWHEITHMMSGIQLATTTAAKMPYNEACFSTKISYDTVSGMVIGKDMPRQSQFGRLRDKSVVFNDYAPAAFAQIRARYGITDGDYLSSLGIDQLKKSLVYGALSSLFEMSSSGRSGSFFYTSHDGRYILKTIPSAEADTLRKILPAYVAHLTKYPNTLLTRFTGLHALIRGTVKQYFVVMANILLNKLPVHETFDLKGSTVNRTTPAEQRGSGVALKDNDFGSRKLAVSPDLKRKLLEQLTLDSSLLSGLNLNDYSLLLGIHISDGALSAPPRELCPVPLHSAFQMFYGGVPTTERTEVLFFGIIDILTDYNMKKLGEHLGKSVLYDGKQVSCVPPKDYHDRFVKYFDTVFVTGGPD